MKRTNIYLTEKQIQELNKMARYLGISVAELVRRAVDHYMEAKRKDLSQ